VKRLPAILISAAVLTACGTAAGSTGSTNMRESANAGAVQAIQAANADSEVNRVNPPITKGARPSPASVARPGTVTPNVVQPVAPPDRCTDGSAAGGVSPRGASSTSGKQFPVPLCLPE